MVHAKEMKNAVLLISAVSIILKTSGYETSQMRRRKRPNSPSPLIFDESLYYKVRPLEVLLGRANEDFGLNILTVVKGQPETNPTTNLKMFSSVMMDYPEMISYYPDIFLYPKSGPIRSVLSTSSENPLFYRDTNSKIYKVVVVPSEPVFTLIDEEEIYFRKISNGELISFIVKRTMPVYTAGFAVHLQTKMEGKFVVDNVGEILYVEIKPSSSSENGKTNLYFPPHFGDNARRQDIDKGYVTDWFLHRKQGALPPDFPYIPQSLPVSQEFMYVTPSLQLYPIRIRHSVLTDAYKTQYINFIKYSNRELIQIRLLPRFSENG